MKRVLFMILCFVFGFSVTLLQPTHLLAASKKPIKLVYSAMLSETAPQEAMDKWYMQEVEKRTKGQVKFTMHFGGAVTKGPETLPAVRKGAVDFSNPPPGYFPDELPIAGLLNVVRLSRDWKSCLDNVYKLQWEDKETSKILEEEGAKQNIKYLTQHPLVYKFITKPKVSRLADLKGLKMRSTGLYEPKHLSRFGAISVNVLPPEWYEAIARGTVDGMSAAWSIAAVFKLQEVTKYVSFHGGATCGRPMVVNLDTWNKLPSEVRAVMEELREESHKRWYEVFPKVLEGVDSQFKAQGVEFLQVDPKEQEELWDEWIRVSIDIWLPNVAKKGAEREAKVVLNRWLELNTGKGLDFWQRKFAQ